MAQNNQPTKKEDLTVILYRAADQFESIAHAVNCFEQTVEPLDRAQISIDKLTESYATLARTVWNQYANIVNTTWTALSPTAQRKTYDTIVQFLEEYRIPLRHKITQAPDLSDMTKVYESLNMRYDIGDQFSATACSVVVCILKGMAEKIEKAPKSVTEQLYLGSCRDAIVLGTKQPSEKNHGATHFWRTEAQETLPSGIPRR